MAVMVIELPKELKTLGEAVQALVAKVIAANRSAPDGRAVDYAPLERDVGALCAAIECQAHAALLQALDIDADRVWIDGKEWVKVERCPGTYYTKAGPTSATRSLFRQVGVRNGRTVDPISLRAGVIGDGWLPDTAQVMAFLHQQSTSREAAASAAKLGRAAYSRSSFETVAHLVGAEYEPRRKDIEDALISTYRPPKEAKSVSVSLDRVSLPMEEPRPRPPGRPRKDAPKRPIARNFRMAYCGTVTLHDAEGAALHTIRYGCMPGGNPADLVAGMAGDVAKLLEKNPELLVAALNDGAHELWNLMALDINEEVLGVKVHRLVDLWHLLEKLGKAGRLLYGVGGAEAALRRWRLALLNRSEAVKDIIWELWRSGRRHDRTDEGRPVHEALTYLLNHRERMNYAGARRKGLPIGSGNVEATCKTLVDVRMKRAGSRWKEETGNHVLQLRALALSDRWDQAVTLALAPLRKAVRAAS